eukprot:COSAG03_NODE_118_length_12325_cov_11.481515_10_plen_106_part_00
MNSGSCVVPKGLDSVKQDINLWVPMIQYVAGREKPRFPGQVGPVTKPNNKHLLTAPRFNSVTQVYCCHLASLSPLLVLCATDALATMDEGVPMQECPEWFSAPQL